MYFCASVGDDRSLWMAKSSHYMLHVAFADVAPVSLPSSCCFCNLCDGTAKGKRPEAIGAYAAAMLLR